MDTIEYKEALWRVVVTYIVALVFLGAPVLIRWHSQLHGRAFPEGFWVIGIGGGLVCLFIAIQSTIVGRVKIRLTESEIDYRTFDVVIPFDTVQEVAETIPLSKTDPSVRDCVWVRLEPGITKSFGFLASRAVETKPDGSVWFPVGIVGQSAMKVTIMTELRRRVGMARNTHA